MFTIDRDTITTSEDNLIEFEANDSHGVHGDLAISFDLLNLLVTMKPEEVQVTLRTIFDLSEK